MNRLLKGVWRVCERGVGAYYLCHPNVRKKDDRGNTRDVIQEPIVNGQGTRKWTHRIICKRYHFLTNRRATVLQCYLSSRTIVRTQHVGMHTLRPQRRVAQWRRNTVSPTGSLSSVIRLRTVSTRTGISDVIIAAIVGVFQLCKACVSINWHDGRTRGTVAEY